MLSLVNAKAFNSMQSQIADDVRLNSIHENLKTWKLMLQVISQKFNISVKKFCSMQLQALLYCNRMIHARNYAETVPSYKIYTPGN